MSSTQATSSATVPTPPTPRPPFTPANAYSRFCKEWVIPGTVIGTGVGSAIGGGLSAWYHRPMHLAAMNVGAKFGFCSFTYMANLTLLSDRVPPEQLPRPAAHAASGFISGALIGGITGRFGGAVRGSLAGVVISLPIWYALEGRHKLTRMSATPEGKPLIRVVVPEGSQSPGRA